MQECHENTRLENSGSKSVGPNMQDRQYEYEGAHTFCIRNRQKYVAWCRMSRDQANVKYAHRLKEV